MYPMMEPSLAGIEDAAYIHERVKKADNQPRTSHHFLGSLEVPYDGVSWIVDLADKESSHQEQKQ